MKRTITLLFISIFLSVFAYSQKAERKFVLVEVATGTWCVNCPGASMGVDQLYEEGKKVAILENHGGDDYESDDSGVRINLYGVTGFPTTVFDGAGKVEGGGPTYNMYSEYLPEYEKALAVQADFEITTKVTPKANGDYNLNINLKKIGTDYLDIPYLFVAYAESHIEVEWFKLPEINFVTRAFYPDWHGTSLNFDTGKPQEQTFDILVSPDPTWLPENSQLIIIVQEMTSYKVCQTDVIELSQFSSAKTIEKNALNIYPNPVSDLINISIPAEIENSCVVEISDLTGKALFSNNYNNVQEQIQIDMTRFVSGMYLLSLKSGNSVYNQKIFVSK